LRFICLLPKAPYIAIITASIFGAIINLTLIDLP
jgi:hypothetical protein